jgi:hypothetical protein
MAYFRILDFFIGNDMSRVHGSMNSFIGDGLLGIPWTVGDGGWHGSMELDVRAL